LRAASAVIATAQIQRRRILGVVEKDLMKIDVELLLVYEIEKEEVDEKEHDDEAWIEEKDEFYGGYHVRER
jgi:hypothetical protein